MTIEELNAAILDGSINELVRVAEARQCKALSKVADIICGRPGVRVVLLAGGSAAGKTTTAKRLATQIRVNDRPALLLSTDDYFVGDTRNPRDENGELDYEAVECVDMELLTSDLAALARGETIPARRFDFRAHEPAEPTGTLALPKGGFVILEGIHALNPLLTAGLDDAYKYRVFVEPQPQLDVIPTVGMSPTESRFLRRIVRDAQFRKLRPTVTMHLWPKVLAGEKKSIEPFRDQADSTFNSYLIYELAVLKAYAGGLLELTRRELGDLPQLNKLLCILALIEVASPDIVPGDSILRETIGGSQLEY